MSFVYMKILESAPLRYDRGLRILSRGRIERVYSRIAEIAAAPGRSILDIGCGTGGAALACAALGGEVVGIDRDPAMLEVARSKPTAALRGSVDWVELGAAEIGDRFPPESFDAAVACLSFSEFPDEERSYVLEVVRGRLRPNGILVIADEVLPPSGPGRMAHHLRRLPFAVAAFLVTQSTTHALRDPTEAVRAAGYSDIELERCDLGSFVILSARRGTDPP